MSKVLHGPYRTLPDVDVSTSSLSAPDRFPLALGACIVPEPRHGGADPSSGVRSVAGGCRQEQPRRAEASCPRHFVVPAESQAEPEGRVCGETHPGLVVLWHRRMQRQDLRVRPHAADQQPLLPVRRGAGHRQRHARRGVRHQRLRLVLRPPAVVDVPGVRSQYGVGAGRRLEELAGWRLSGVGWVLQAGAQRVQGDCQPVLGEELRRRAGEHQEPAGPDCGRPVSGKVQGDWARAQRWWAGEHVTEKQSNFALRPVSSC